MKVPLAPRYRMWMLLLLPATFGVGTAALWARSLGWPCGIDAEGLTLRCRRKVRWEAIRQIVVVRDYLDGHVARIDIHRRDGISRIPVRALNNGERIATVILAMFKQSRRAGASGAVTSVPALLPELPTEPRDRRARNFRHDNGSGDDGGTRIHTTV